MNKKKKEQRQLKIEDQGNYADSNRNIAVAIDSRDLAKALKSIKRAVVCTDGVLKLYDEKLIVRILMTSTREWSTV